MALQRHDAYAKRGEEIELLVAKAESPEAGPLVDQWFAWLKSANGVRLWTRRRYAPNTICPTRRQQRLSAGGQEAIVFGDEHAGLQWKMLLQVVDRALTDLRGRVGAYARALGAALWRERAPFFALGVGAGLLVRLVR